MAIGLKRGLVELTEHNPKWKTLAAQTIAVAVKNLSEVEELIPKLSEAGFFKSKLHAVEGDILVCDDNEFTDTRSYHIHIVESASVQWRNYINFRDYLNENPDSAKEYERVKITAAENHPSDRNAYTDDKEEILIRLLHEVQVWASRFE